MTPTTLVSFNHDSHFFINRTLGASWCLPSSARPYRLLWLVVASICSALLTLSTRLHLFRALRSAHSLVLLTLWPPLLYFRFSFGSEILKFRSAFNTLQALDVDPILNMLVFGESILNDAVSIVLTTTIVESGDSEVQDSSMAYQVGAGIGRWFYHCSITSWASSGGFGQWKIGVRRQCANLGSSWCSLALLELGHWWQCWVHLSWNTLTCTQTQGTDILAVNN